MLPHEQAYFYYCFSALLLSVFNFVLFSVSVALAGASFSWYLSYFDRWRLNYWNFLNEWGAVLWHRWAFFFAVGAFYFGEWWFVALIQKIIFLPILLWLFHHLKFKLYLVQWLSTLQPIIRGKFCVKVQWYYFILYHVIFTLLLQFLYQGCILVSPANLLQAIHNFFIIIKDSDGVNYSLYLKYNVRAKSG